MRLKPSKSPKPASITASRCSRSLAKKHCASPASKVANCSVSSRRASVWSSSGWAFKWISTRSSSPPMRANVKSSMTHHSLEQYVGPATTSSVWQPARKTGKQASDCWMSFWSMQALSCGARREVRRFTEHACVV